jgi:uncharacterized membrane protein YfcA
MRRTLVSSTGRSRDITLETVLLSSLVVAAAFMIRGLVGFGSGLLMVPLLLLLFDIQLVVPTAASLAVLAGVLSLSTFETWKYVRKDLMLMMLAGVIVGIVLGAFVLASYGGELLKRLFGVFVALYALKMLFWNEVKVWASGRYGGLVAGLVGGCLGGMFGTGGPPVVMYLDTKVQDKRAFRATLIFYFLVANTWQFVANCFTGLINGEVLRFALYLLPAFVVGNLAGAMLHVKINQALFNKVVALVLLVTGVLLVV